jgi:hypothetical protein
MSNERNSAVVLFAVAVIIAILAAFATTLGRVDTRTANNEDPRRASLRHARHWIAHQANRC